jgi:hypothetical protein
MDILRELAGARRVAPLTPRTRHASMRSGVSMDKTG